jgi:hypothetical protein
MERTREILESWESDDPDIVNYINQEIKRLNEENVLSIYRMVKREYWEGQARGWEKLIPEGAKYVILETELRSKDGPRAMFIKSDPPKGIMFDKAGY